jgi:hypothetical protein
MPVNIPSKKMFYDVRKYSAQYLLPSSKAVHFTANSTAQGVCVQKNGKYLYTKIYLMQRKESLGSARRAPSLIDIPWNLPYN